MAKRPTKVPKKYTAGLPKKTAKKRVKQTRARAKAARAGNPNYSPMVGDKGAKTRKSKYTRQAEKSGLKKRISERMRSNTRRSYLSAVSKETGIPYGILKDVHKRGAAAWATGHRPGATQEAWARARVMSFVQGGKTTKTADKDLHSKALKAKRGK